MRRGGALDRGPPPWRLRPVEPARRAPERFRSVRVWDCDHRLTRPRGERVREAPGPALGRGAAPVEGLCPDLTRDYPIMNISKAEQRVLHALAQGGAIRFERAAGGKLQSVFCVTREGHILSDATLAVVRRLVRKGLIRSTEGRPYRISRKGRAAVRPQLDNR